jgi:hypothetical protein
LLNSVFEGWASHDPRAAHTAALALTSDLGGKMRTWIGLT